MRYYAHTIAKGTLRYRDVPGAMGVLESPGVFMPIGQAFCHGPDDQGRAVFRLTVRGQQIAGEFHIIDGEFRPAPG